MQSWAAEQVIYGSAEKMGNASNDYFSNPSVASRNLRRKALNTEAFSNRQSPNLNGGGIYEPVDLSMIKKPVNKNDSGFTTQLISG